MSHEVRMMSASGKRVSARSCRYRHKIGGSAAQRSCEAVADDRVGHDRRS